MCEGHSEPLQRILSLHKGCFTTRVPNYVVVLRTRRILFIRRNFLTILLYTKIVKSWFLSIWDTFSFVPSKFTTMDSFDSAQPPSSEMIAVVSRIQERALHLASQRGLRDVAQAELETMENRLRQEQFTNAEIRRKLLIEVRNRHGLEIELLNIRDQAKERAERIGDEKNQAMIEDKNADKMEYVWKQSIQDIYASHEVQQQIYLRSLEKRIQNRQQESKKRERKMEFLNTQTSKFIQEELFMVDEVQRMQNAAQLIDLREETEDEEVSNLAMMIKVTLTKVRTKRITSPHTSFFAYAQHVFVFFVLHSGQTCGRP
jgi:hypothetical protein